MSFNVFVGLMICNIQWAINPALSKVLVDEIGPFGAAWFRYAGAFVAYVVIALALDTHHLKGETLKRLSRPDIKGYHYFLKPFDQREKYILFALGVLTFFMGPTAQMFGLMASTAVNNAIFVALEPIFTWLLSAFLLGQALTMRQFSSFFIAIFGFCLLSRLLPGLAGGGGGGSGPAMAAAATKVSSVVGDLVLLLGVFGDSFFPVLASGLARRHRPLPIYGTPLLIGVVLLTLSLVMSLIFVPEMTTLSKLSLKGWAVLLWVGPFGTTITYAYWIALLHKGVPLASLALTLYLQPIVGAITGWVMLGEHLSGIQLVGAGLILFAVSFHLSLGGRFSFFNLNALMSALTLPWFRVSFRKKPRNKSDKDKIDKSVKDKSEGGGGH